MSALIAPARFAAASAMSPLNLPVAGALVVISTVKPLGATRPFCQVTPYTVATGGTAGTPVDIPYGSDNQIDSVAALAARTNPNGRLEINILYSHDAAANDFTQTTSANRPRLMFDPVTGLAYITFQGNDFMTGPAGLTISSQSASVFMGCFPDTAAQNSTLYFALGTTAGSSIGLTKGSVTNNGLMAMMPSFTRPTAPSKGLAPRFGPTVLGMTSSASARLLHVDDLVSTNQTTAVASYTMTGAYIGNTPDTVGAAFGRFFNFVVYDTALSAPNAILVKAEMGRVISAVPHSAATKQLIFHGDSFVAGAGATSLMTSWLKKVLDLAAGPEVECYAFGNSGATAVAIGQRRAEAINQMDTTKSKIVFVLSSDWNDGMAPGLASGADPAAAVTSAWGDGTTAGLLFEIRAVKTAGAALGANLTVVVTTPTARQASISGWGTGTIAADWTARDGARVTGVRQTILDNAAAEGYVVADTANETTFQTWNSTDYADAVHPDDSGSVIYGTSVAAPVAIGLA